jgi:hypothetical protein
MQQQPSTNISKPPTTARATQQPIQHRARQQKKEGPPKGTRQTNVHILGHPSTQVGDQTKSFYRPIRKLASSSAKQIGIVQRPLHSSPFDRPSPTYPADSTMAFDQYGSNLGTKGLG